VLLVEWEAALAVRACGAATAGLFVALFLEASAVRLFWHLRVCSGAA